MKKIPLTKGAFAIVDDCDFERASVDKWRINCNGYAICDRYDENKKHYAFFMHRFILNVGRHSGMDIDHINGDRADNRRENLRICTKRQNSCNSKKKSSNTSGYKGASWSKTSKKWYAQIRINGKKTSLGHFNTVEEAHEAYCKAAIEHHKEFARFS